MLTGKHPEFLKNLNMSNSVRNFILIVLLSVVSALIALPESLTLNLPFTDGSKSITVGSPVINTVILGRPVYKKFEFKQGLDIQGGMQVVLSADVSGIADQDRLTALDSAREIIMRRVDLYGIAEPSVQTAISGNDYRLLVELPGVSNPEEALQLVGQTAELDFRLVQESETTPDQEELTEFNEVGVEDSTIELVPTGITGQQLRRASVQFDQTTGEPVVFLEFDDRGREMFSEVTSENTGELLGIFIDGGLIMAPRINTPIIDGKATITGGFTIEEAKQLSIQLNAGALPVPIEVLEQRTIGASLGQDSVQKSLQAGVIGIGLVMLFMTLYYGMKGVLASLALLVYALLTIAIYKTIGVTITLPGLAGLILSIGMAVDANILIFERMKEELRIGKPFAIALELGFGRAWDSIKDANLATIITALILINPMNFSFLNTSGLVRGFGITLLIGVLLSLFTGVLVTRTFLRLFLKPEQFGAGLSNARKG